MTHFNLTEREWFGRLVPKDTEEYYDPKQMGRYKVHIPALMPHLEKEEGIWVKNQVHKWRITPSEVGEYGQYFPIQPKTYVIIKFYENDINTGYIDRIISDWKEERDVEAQDCVDAKPVLEDRDEQYILFKTPKKWNAFYINEETDNEPNTIYLIYNRDDNPERRTVYRINEEGIHVWTRDNVRVRILKDENTQIDGDRTRYVKGDQRQNIYGNDNTEIRKNRITDVKINEHYHIWGNYIRRVRGNCDYLLNGNYTHQIDGNNNYVLKGNYIRHIEKNYDYLLNGNYTHQIDGDDNFLLKGNYTHQIDGDEDYWLKGNYTRQIDGDYNQLLKGGLITQSDKDSDCLFKGNETKETKGSVTYRIHGDLNLEVEGDINIIARNKFVIMPKLGITKFWPDPPPPHLPSPKEPEKSEDPKEHDELPRLPEKPEEES